MESHESPDVLVVGAGPTGLMLSCELARHGVSFRVVDKAEAPTTLSKAIGVHARTLEVFEDLGISEEMVSRGVKLFGVSLYADGRPVVEAGFGELDTRYPYLLSIPQSETEGVLERRLTRLGTAVERSVELIDFTQDDSGVTATLQHADGHEETVRTRYLVGCDGAHSRVRKGASLAFDGSAYEDRFLLADVRADFALPRDRVVSFLDETGILACFPIPENRWRLIATTSAAPPPGAESEPPPLADVQALTRQRSRQNVTLTDAAWLASFRIHCRQVKRYREGRAFLAGDAAHIHSPVGGQGMNTGIQDAHNLAWKLALVVKGQARPELLDSYHAERHAVGVALLQGTDVATRVATLRHPVARAIRDRAASFLSSLEVIQQRMARSVAELTLTYRGSPIVEEHATPVYATRLGSAEASERPTLDAWRQFALAPRAGDRAPDGMVLLPSGGTKRLYELFDGRQHALLLFDGRAATDEGYATLGSIARRVRADYGELVKAYVVVPKTSVPRALGDDVPVLLDPEGDIEHRYGAVAECVYLVRPDLYVGYRGQPADPDDLFRYLGRMFV